MRQKYLTIITVLIVINLILVWQVYAGSPEPPGPPEATNSYTLADLYNRLNDGTTGSHSTFTEPDTAPGESAMPTINEIMAQAPTVDEANGASSNRVLSGRTFWGLRSGQWGQRTGTMPNLGAFNITPKDQNQAIPPGYHNGQGIVVGDDDLIADNIRKGINLFGVHGALDPGAIPVQSTVPRTGQTTCHDATGAEIPCAGTGQDGEYQMGSSAVLEPSGGTNTGAYLVPAWSGERFTDNGDGTVRDNMTGLVWLKDTNCFGGETWLDALTVANTLANGSCGLSDGSSAGDWRLPNINELHSLIKLSPYKPALPSGHPFTGFRFNNSNYRWSSTPRFNSASAWMVIMDNGWVAIWPKSAASGVWPVRGGTERSLNP